MVVEVQVKRGQAILSKRRFGNRSAAESYASLLRKRVAKGQSVTIVGQDTITTVGLTSRQRARSIKQSKADKRSQFKWGVKSTLQRLLGKDLTSSFVSSLDFNTENGDVDVLLSGKKYRFFNVPEAIFVSWTKGAATCQTSDNGKVKRWWIGKTPSLGAFFNHYIKNKYGWVKM